MSTKHETKVHAIPTVIKLIPAKKENLKDMFSSSYNDVYCVFEKDGEYELGCFDKLQLDAPRKKFSVYPINKYSVQKIDSEKVFFAYFENEYSTFFSVGHMEAFKDLIGTRKHAYFDMIQSCGRDFTYQKPYVQFYAQPNIKNRHIELRKKFADVLSITIHVDELDNKLFRDIQKLAIEKYDVIKNVIREGWKHKGLEPCKVLNEIPIELRNGKLDFKNRISFVIYDSSVRKTPHILMKAGEYHHEMGLSAMYMRTIHKDIHSIEQMDELLGDLQRYTRLIPKINSPWHYH